MRRFFILGLIVAALVILVGVGFLAWIGTEGGLTPVPPASEGARDIQALYVFIGAFASAVFLVVTIPLALFVVRFRRAGRDRSVEGPQIRGNTRLELMWIGGPILILVAIATFTFLKLPGIMEPRASAEQGPDLTIRVEGRQFYWRYVYPGDVIAIDTLRVPVDRNVRLEVTAPEGDVRAQSGDVIHSFWVPALGGKIDAIPGVLNRMGFRATRTGTFPGRCAELCGIQHGAMVFDAIVLPQEEFDAWLEEEAAAQQAEESELGQQLFDLVCSKCHFAAPEYAPNIAGSPLLADREQLEVIVREGRRRMPSVGQGWTERELDALFAFIGGAGGG